MAIVFQLVMAAAKTSRRLSGNNRLPQVIEGAGSRDGIQVNTPTNPPPPDHAITQNRS